MLQTSIQRMLGLRVMVTGRRSFIALVDRTLDSGLVTSTQASYTSLITAISQQSTNTMQGFTKILLLRVISSLSRLWRTLSSSLTPARSTLSGTSWTPTPTPS